MSQREVLEARAAFEESIRHFPGSTEIIWGQEELKRLLDAARRDGLDSYQLWANSLSSCKDTPSLHDTRVCFRERNPLPEGVNIARIDHATAGITSESGEIAEHVKHVRFAGKALDREHLIKEAGDMLWYLAELAAGLGVPLSEIAARNEKKLRARYEGGTFTVAGSENRKPENE